MKYTFQLFILSYLIVSVTFCKKKEVPSIKTPESCVVYSSFRLFQYYSVINNSLILNGRIPHALLQKQCKNNKAPQSIIVSSILFNSTSLNIDIASWWTECESDTVSQNTFPPFTWQINGSSEYPSFTETINDSLPRFSKFNMIPDSMSKSNTTVLQLGGYNADTVQIYIDNGMSGGAPRSAAGMYHSVSASVSSTSTTLNYDPNITSPSTCSLMIVYSKNYSKTINDKIIRFSLFSIYKKKIKFTD